MHPADPGPFPVIEEVMSGLAWPELANDIAREAAALKPGIQTMQYQQALTTMPVKVS